jgi:hypothetical protein
MKNRKRLQPVKAIPAIPDPSSDPREAVRALARAALIFRGVFIMAGEGRSVRAILEERRETLLLAGAVLDKWLAFLEIDASTGEDLA